jgi:hypothetical protein
MKTGLTAMIYRDFDSGRAPTRAPQHAAHFGVPARSLFRRRPRLSVAFRRRTRRTLRVVVTTGMWAAGLCLAIGSLALVVAAADPGHTHSLTPTAQQMRLAHPNPGILHVGQGSGSGAAAAHPHASPSSQSPSSAGHTAMHVLAAFAGHGSAITRHFRVVGTHRFGVRWSYDCPPRRSGGQFIMREADIVAGKSRVGPGIEETGTSGNGITWLTSAKRSHFLLVVSDCAWTMRVVKEI